MDFSVSGNHMTSKFRCHGGYILPRINQQRASGCCEKHSCEPWPSASRQERVTQWMMVWKEHTPSSFQQ
ncbi:hypothetical protein STEG23_036158, partial [Scotinomys teguina]